MTDEDWPPSGKQVLARLLLGVMALKGFGTTVDHKTSMSHIYDTLRANRYTVTTDGDEIKGPEEIGRYDVDLFYGKDSTIHVSKHGKPIGTFKQPLFPIGKIEYKESVHDDFVDKTAERYDAHVDHIEERAKKKGVPLKEYIIIFLAFFSLTIADLIFSR